MKRFVIFCLSLLCLFAAMAFVYDAAVLWLMKHTPSNAAVKMARIAEGGKGESIAIFGSSRAITGYVPSCFDKPTFNYGMNGMMLGEVLFVVDLYLRNNHSDSTVLINVDPWGFTGPNANKLFGDYRLLNKKKRDTFKDLDIGWTDCLPGFRFQGNLRTALKEYLNDKKGLSRKSDNGAVLLLNSRSKEEWVTIKKDLKPYEFYIDENCERQIEELYSHQGKHRIVWVVAPSCPAHHDILKNPDALSKFIATQSARQNVSVINLFDEVSQFPDEMFVDPTHLNIHGAKKFSEQLFQVMGKN